MPTTLEDTPLDRLLGPVTRCLTAEVAQRLIDLRPEPATQARINELAARANEGLLSDAERVEYEEYVEAIDLLAIIQSKARKALARQGT